MIDSTTVVSRGTGNGVATEFDYGFRIADQDHVQVWIADATTEVETLKTIVADYTVDGVGNDEGGTVTFAVAPDSGDKIVLKHVVPLDQETDLRHDGAWDPQQHEDAYDKLTHAAQAVDEQAGRALRLGLAVTGVDPKVVGTPAADQLLVTNAAGDGFEWLAYAGAVLPTTHGDNFLVKTDGEDTGQYQLTGVLVDDSNNVVIPGYIKSGSAGTQITTAAGLLRHQAINPLIAGDGLSWADGVLSADAGGFSGSGTPNTIGMWIDENTLGDSKLTQTGSSVQANAQELVVRKAAIGSIVSLASINQDTTDTGSDALVQAAVAAPTSGDPYFSWSVAGAQSYVMGIDNSVAGDPLVGSVGGAIGTANWLQVDASRNVTLPVSLTVNSGADGMTILGNTKIGSVDGGDAVFALFSKFTDVLYALKQTPDSETTLNSSTVVNLAISNVNQVTLVDGQFMLSTAVELKLNGGDLLVDGGDLFVDGGTVGIGVAPSAGTELAISDGLGAAGDPLISFNGSLGQVFFNGSGDSMMTLRGGAGKGAALHVNGGLVGLNVDASGNVDITDGWLDVASWIRANGTITSSAGQITSSDSSGTVNVTCINTGVGAAVVGISTQSGSLDPYVKWQILPAGQVYVLGIDNSVAGDPLVGAVGGVLGTSNWLEVDASRNVTLPVSLTVAGYSVGVHTVASHSDTTATGAQLNTLVGGGETTLHSHAGGGGDPHTIASHTDTSATGTELNTLTNNAMADTLHRHSELSASDGTPDAVLSLSAAGYVTISGLLTATPSLTVSRNGTTAGAPVVKIVQDNATVGNVPLELQQDTVSDGMIEFTGSDRGVLSPAIFAYSVRVVLNGVVRRIGIVADG